jgi:uncharacterized membrane protein
MHAQEDSEKLVFQETRLRSLVKTVVYRIMSIAGTFLLTWLITRDIREVISITLAVQAFLIVLYYASERIWDRISWGRRISIM